MPKSEKKIANLTKRVVAALSPDTKPYRVWDAGGRESVKGLYIRVQPSGSMSYYLSYRNDKGTLINYLIGNTGKITPVQARDVAARLRGQIALGIDVQDEKKKKIAEKRAYNMKTLGGFLEQKYNDWVENNRKSGKGMAERVQRNFPHLMTKPLDKITPWDIDKWRSKEKKRGKSPVTINRDVGGLKSVLSKAVEWDIIEIHPLSKIKPLKIDKAGRVRYLTAEESVKLRCALNERDRLKKEERERYNEWRKSRGQEPYQSLMDKDCSFADYLQPMVLLSLNTGVRRNELFSLKWENINFELRQLTVVGEVAKSAQTRHIDLNDEALQTLKAWRKQQKDPQGLLFYNNKKKMFGDVRSSWARLKEMAGIVDFRWHDMRHDFASKLVMAGVELNTVRELLGHSSMTMTLRYAHLAPEHKAAAVAKLNKGNLDNIAQSLEAATTEKRQYKKG